MSSLSVMDLESTKQPRKRLIIKFSSQKNHSTTSKPIVTCFWLDAKDSSTAIMSQQNNNNELSTPTTDCVKDSKPILSKEGAVQVTKDSCSKKIIKKMGVTKDSCPKKIIKKMGNETRNPRTENCVLKTDGGEIKNEKKKKPMQHYKKMQCWVILKRMLVGRDSWPLKDPIDLKFLDAFHNKSLEDNLENKSKLKTMGLKDIEAKLGLYSTPDEFAEDIRFVFSQTMSLYPPRNEIHKIAMRLSESFENKWKSLKRDWELEERKRKRYEHVYGGKDFFQTKRSKFCAR